jgi:hypothetical protein
MIRARATTVTWARGAEAMEVTGGVAGKAGEGKTAAAKRRPITEHVKTLVTLMLKPARELTSARPKRGQPVVHDTAFADCAIRKPLLMPRRLPDAGDPAELISRAVVAELVDAQR